jgi:hypothetical protein
VVTANNTSIKNAAVICFTHMLLLAATGQKYYIGATLLQKNKKYLPGRI